MHATEIRAERQRNVAQGRRREGIEQRNQLARFAVDPFGFAATFLLPTGGRRPCSAVAYARMRPGNALLETKD